MDLPRFLFAQSHVRPLPLLLFTYLELTRSIFDAGGTIRSASNYSRLDNVNYGSGPGPTARDLIGNYSEVLTKAQLAIISYPTVGGSSGLNSTLYFNISRDANRLLCAEGSDIAGGTFWAVTPSILVGFCGGLDEIPSFDDSLSIGHTLGRR